MTARERGTVCAAAIGFLLEISLHLHVLLS